MGPRSTNVPRSPIIPIALAAFVIVVSTCAVVVAVAYHQVKSFRGEVVELQRQLAATKARLVRVERRLSVNAQPTLTPDAQSFRMPSVSLDSNAVAYIRSVIVVPPVQPGTLPTLTMGSEISHGALLTMPEPISERFPKLRGMMVTTDRDGAIVLVGRDSRRVEFIIPAR
jgi:hypothetical protein